MNLKSFFKRQILVARVYGIPVRIDYRWFVVFALSVVLIASNVSKYPMQIVTVRLPAFGDLPGLWLGLATTLALFLSVFGHELSHALVAVFNLFPGYPLDGGRVLRAIIWKRTGNINDATRIAGFCGQLIAAVLIVFGLYMAFAPSFRAYFMGFWSVLVGLFLLSAATS